MHFHDFMLVKFVNIKVNFSHTEVAKNKKLSSEADNVCHMSCRCAACTSMT
jgi:hypothetical protein